VKLDKRAMGYLEAAKANLASSYHERRPHNKADPATFTPEQLADMVSQKPVSVKGLEEFKVTFIHESEVPLVEKDRCLACGKESMALKKCSGTCEPKARFCGPECLKAAWPEHKKVCGRK
jgi:hypothetical protein